MAININQQSCRESILIKKKYSVLIMDQNYHNRGCVVAINFSNGLNNI